MNVLIVTTSASAMGDHPTGLWLEEFAVPYLLLQEAGARITVASPRGGAVPLDPKTEPDAEQRTEWARPLAALRETRVLAEVDPAGFDAVFFPGGHGPLVDLVGDEQVQRVTEAIDARGGIVASVCHGPAAIVRVRRRDGTPLVQGRRVTGFTNTEETLAGLKSKVPFLLQDALKEAGADVRSNLVPFTSRVEVDGPLITGQNPQSSQAVGEALVKALRGREA